MGKQKRKNHRPDEELLGEIRNLKKQLRELQHENRRLEKELGYNQNTIREIIEEQLPDCMECGKGFLREIVVLDRRIKVCNVCDYRSRAIKIHG